MDRSVDGTERRLRPPSLFLMLAEARGVLELNSSLLLSPLLLQAPKGDGHPVLALPGFLASDLSGYTSGTIVTVDGGAASKRKAF